MKDNNAYVPFSILISGYIILGYWRGGGFQHPYLWMLEGAWWEIILLIIFMLFLGTLFTGFIIRPLFIFLSLAFEVLYETILKIRYENFLIWLVKLPFRIFIRIPLIAILAVIFGKEHISGTRKSLNRMRLQMVNQRIEKLKKFINEDPQNESLKEQLSESVKEREGILSNE